MKILNLFKRKELLGQNKVQSSDGEYETLFEIGLNLYLTQDFDSAINSLSATIEKYPKNAELLYIRGCTFEDFGDINSAKNDFLKSIKINPDCVGSNYRLGMIHANNKEHKEAIPYLKKALDKIGNYNLSSLEISTKVICSNLGVCMIQNGEANSGVKYLDKAIELDPIYPNPFMAKGLYLIKENKIEEGLKLLIKAESLGSVDAKRAIMDIENSMTSDLLLLAKNLSEDSAMIRSMGGIKLREPFKNDLGKKFRSMINNYGSIRFSDVIIVAVDYNLDMWRRFNQINPSIFNDTMKALISHEVTLSIKNLQMIDFDFDKVYKEIFLKTKSRF